MTPSDKLDSPRTHTVTAIHQMLSWSSQIAHLHVSNITHNPSEAGTPPLNGLSPLGHCTICFELSLTLSSKKRTESDRQKTLHKNGWCDSKMTQKLQVLVLLSAEQGPWKGQQAGERQSSGEARNREGIKSFLTQNILPPLRYTLTNQTRAPYICSQL